MYYNLNFIKIIIYKHINKNKIMVTFKLVFYLTILQILKQIKIVNY